MIIFLSIPRAFQGEFLNLQRMAITSWRGTDPDCDIILFGVDDSIAEGADDLNVRYCPHLVCNEKGRPTIEDVFEIGEQQARANWICFISADIVLGATLKDVLHSVEQIDRPFVIGQRFDLEPGAPKHTAKLHAACGVDYFIYRPDTIPTDDIPPFIVSGGGGDNWFVWKALTAWDMTVIDATEALTAIHINHSHPEWPNGKEGRQGSPEQAHNRQLYLADGMDRVCGVNDASWVLGADFVLRKRDKIIA